MTAPFFDTTYLCKLRWPEPGSTEVTACAASANVLASGAHSRAEFCSLSHRKLPEGAATREGMAAAVKQFNQECQIGVVRLLPLTEAVFQRVNDAYLKASQTQFLRAGDALHLACAAEYGFTEVYSNDRHFLAAAPLFGLLGINVIP